MPELIKVTCVGPIAPGENISLKTSVDALITQTGNMDSLRRAVSCPALQDDLSCALSPDNQCVYLASARMRKPQPVPVITVEGKSMGSNQDNEKLESTYLTLREVSEVTRLDFKTICTRMEGLQITPFTSQQLIEQGVAVNPDKRPRYLSLAQVMKIAPDREISFQEYTVAVPEDVFTERFLNSFHTLNEVCQVLGTQPNTLRKYLTELGIKPQDGPRSNAKYITGKEVKALYPLIEARRKNKTE